MSTTQISDEKKEFSEPIQFSCKANFRINFIYYPDHYIVLMKSLVFDSGPIISLVTNNLLWVLEELKKRYDGEFYISPSVKKEIIDVPLRSKRFRLEALQLASFISRGIIKIYKPGNTTQLNFFTKKLLNLANNMFICRGVNVRLVHLAEIEALALANLIKADALVVDERSTRVLVENPEILSQLLEKKLHSPIDINIKAKKEFLEEVKDTNIIRSVELMAVAYDFGILDKYALKEVKFIKSTNLRKNLLEGVLWGLKLRGCAISSDEIYDIMKLKGF